jgi:glutathione synthase/RimK-type ligase-like ATP-grasp enzyme
MEMMLLTRFFKYAQNHNVSKLLTEAKTEGVRLSVVKPTDIRLRLRDQNNVNADKPVLRYLNQTWNQIDLVIPLMRHDDEYGWDVLDALQVNNQRVLKVTKLPQSDRDKMQLLFKSIDLEMPRTFIGDRSFIWRNRATLPWPFIARARVNNGQRLVKKISNWNELDETLHEYENVVEEPIFMVDAAALNGEYVTTLTIGNDVAAALVKKNGLQEVHPKRIAQPREVLTATALSVQEIEMLRKIRKVYGAVFVSIDFVRTPQGPQIIEVNTAPNMTLFEDIAGKNFAKMLVKTFKDMIISTKVK